MILLFAGAYTRQVHIPLPDSAQAAVTILRGDESAWNGEAAEERCLVCCRIPMMFSNPRIAGDFWKTWDFQSLYLSESRKWRSAEMGQVYSWGYQGTKQVASTPIRGYYQSNQPERFKDGYRPLRMCKHFKTDQCWRGQECPSSFLRVSYETEAPLRFSLGFLFPYDVSIWISCLINCIALLSL